MSIERNELLINGLPAPTPLALHNLLGVQRKVHIAGLAESLPPRNYCAASPSVRETRIVGGDTCCKEFLIRPSFQYGIGHL